MKNQNIVRSAFLSLRILLGLLVFFFGMLLATFAAGHLQPSTHERARQMGNHLRLKRVPVAPVSGVSQAWVARYNGPGNSYDEATAIAADGSGNVYVTGYSEGSAGYDYATIKYDTAGQQQWIRRYVGPAHAGDYASAIAVDGSSNIYVAGY